MTAPVLTFFNNKGGVGKTSLAYHLAWMLSQSGQRVLACDLDPQANLTAAFLDEERLSELWIDAPGEAPTTIYRCIAPLLRVGDLRSPELEHVSGTLALLPGDLALSGFEDRLSSEWANCMGATDLLRPFRIVSALWQVAQLGALQHRADIVLFDVGPNLGPMNRSALIGSDFVLVPLGADLFSLQGLRNLGPTLHRWRSEWKKRLDNWQSPEFELPSGAMTPLGYVVQQHSVRLSRPVMAYDRWVKRIPEEYRASILGQRDGGTQDPRQDPHCLATLKHYRSLVPMAQEARKPIFELTTADGAIGSHAQAVAAARRDFRILAARILDEMRAKGPRPHPATGGAAHA